MALVWDSRIVRDKTIYAFNRNAISRSPVFAL